MSSEPGDGAPVTAIDAERRSSRPPALSPPPPVMAPVAAGDPEVVRSQQPPAALPADELPARDGGLEGSAEDTDRRATTARSHDIEALDEGAPAAAEVHTAATVEPHGEVGADRAPRLPMPPAAIPRPAPVAAPAGPSPASSDAAAALAAAPDDEMEPFDDEEDETPPRGISAAPTLPTATSATDTSGPADHRPVDAAVSADRARLDRMAGGADVVEEETPPVPLASSDARAAAQPSGAAARSLPRLPSVAPAASQPTIRHPNRVQSPPHSPGTTRPASVPPGRIAQSRIIAVGGSKRLPPLPVAPPARASSPLGAELPALDELVPDAVEDAVEEPEALAARLPDDLILRPHGVSGDPSAMVDTDLGVALPREQLEQVRSVEPAVAALRDVEAGTSPMPAGREPPAAPAVVHRAPVPPPERPPQAPSSKASSSQGPSLSELAGDLGTEDAEELGDADAEELGDADAEELGEVAAEEVAGERLESRRLPPSEAVEAEAQGAQGHGAGLGDALDGLPVESSVGVGADVVSLDGVAVEDGEALAEVDYADDGTDAPSASVAVAPALGPPSLAPSRREGRPALGSAPEIVLDGPRATVPAREEELEGNEPDVLVEGEDGFQLKPKKPPPPPKRSRPPGESRPPAGRTEAEPSARVRPWWEELFSDDFNRAVKPLSAEQVAREVTFIEESLGVAKGGVILDLACGSGQHAVEISGRGYGVVGFDLSLPQLAVAGEYAQERGQKINFLQGDMRDMAFEDTFDGIFCWNTSFGYFEEEKNLQVAHRVFRALRPGGSFLVDVVNRDFAAEQQPCQVWFEGDACVCMDDMVVDFITSRLKVKRTLMLDDGRTRECSYSIRLYSLHELGKLLHDVGFRVMEASGHPALPGVFFGLTAPRVIILAQKP